jgi:hypothetical protein
VPTVRLPRTAVSRRQKTYAKLIRRVYPRREFAAFEGRVFRCGALIDVAELWPDQRYPGAEVGHAWVLEYAGNDGTGRGHVRSNDIYVLWRYERKRNAFTEIVRSVSQGKDWLDAIRYVAMREIGRVEIRDPLLAENACGRVLAVLDAELEILTREDRGLVMSFVYEQFTARVCVSNHV